MYPAPRRSAAAFFVVAAFLLGVLPAVASAAVPTFFITGRGFGHGIGMSQYGARGLAAQMNPATGKLYSASEIMRYYYGNTTRTACEKRASKDILVRLDPAASSSNQGFTATSWTVRAGHQGERLKISAGNLTTAVTMPADHWYRFTVTSSGITVYDVDAGAAYKPGGVATLTGTVTLYETSTSPQLVQVKEGTGIYDKAYNRYRGRLLISSNGTKLKLVNRLPLEQYLYGVVPREMPAEWGSKTPAALAAQAIAARSYAYPSSGELYCTTYSQAYQGHSAGSDRTATSSSVGEHSLSNKAVDSTTGLVVVYTWPSGTKELVTTYFSDTSGGHTANIEDVWTTSDPKPFYTGVPDPDDSSPYHASWGAAIKLTGDQLAEKVRSWYGAAGTQPKPAYVQNVSIERVAGSGFARRVTLTWNTGDKQTVSGNSFHSAIGVKSTKFAIGVGSALPAPSVTEFKPGPLRYQDTDSRMVHVGPWAQASKSGLSGGTHHASDAALSRFVATFDGAGVIWVGTKGPSCGKATVYIDGAYRGTADLYSRSTVYQAAVARFAGLSDGPHTIQIVPTGTHSAGATGSWVTVDAIDVVGTGLLQAAHPLTTADDSTRLLAHTGPWELQTGSTSLSNGTQSLAETTGATFYIAFKGTGVSWYGSSSPNYGYADVSVDGKAATRVDCGGAATAYGKKIWSASGLPWGDHVVKITALGEAPEGRVGTHVSVDRLEVVDGQLVQASPPAIVVQENHPALAYSGTWTRFGSASLSGGAMVASPLKDATARVSFDGTAVQWIGTRGPKYGRANVYVDGAYKATVDLYSASAQFRRTLFAASGLPSGTHSLRIKVLGTKSTASTGTNVGVDALTVWGLPTIGSTAVTATR